MISDNGTIKSITVILSTLLGFPIIKGTFGSPVGWNSTLSYYFSHGITQACTLLLQSLIVSLHWNFNFTWHKMTCTIETTVKDHLVTRNNGQNAIDNSIIKNINTLKSLKLLFIFRLFLLVYLTFLAAYWCRVLYDTEILGYFLAMFSFSQPLTI